MVDFLKAGRFMPELAALVKARNPLKPKKRQRAQLRHASTVVHDIEEVSNLIDEIENTQSGIPVLLRQYLRLGGKLLGFNVDPDFGYVLDGLILVDLSKTDPKLAERYLGKEGVVKFLAYHNVTKPAGE
jgi:hypothetical protein